MKSLVSYFAYATATHRARRQICSVSFMAAGQRERAAIDLARKIQLARCKCCRPLETDTFISSDVCGFCHEWWFCYLDMDRVTHIMPIFPPIMLCSYAQLLPCYSFPAATYYAHFMLTFTVQIPTKNQRMRQFSSLSDLKSMVACKVCDPWLGSSVSHCQTSKK